MFKVMPFPGEEIRLLCTECNHDFLGTEPDWGKKLKEVCPKCGSKKVLKNPFICY